jgi:hypothetical protein
MKCTGTQQNQMGSLKEKLLKSGVMGGKMLCITGLRDVTTAGKVLGFTLQAVL